ncbi:MAG TPA: PAS domain-containing protein [Polyangiaceae bacterium]|nr:PAS domain-containing protein [Polyangiaceae bacterium]
MRPTKLGLSTPGKGGRKQTRTTAPPASATAKKKARARPIAATERERFEQALRAANSRLAAIIETIPHGFAVIDREGRYTDVSDRALHALGMTRADVMGRTLWEVFPETAGDFRAHCERAWTDQQPVTFEYYHPALACWYEAFLHPSAYGLAIQGRDITARKEAEQALRESELRLRTVLENTPEGYAIYDADRRIEYVNPVLLRLTNYRFEDIIGKRDEELFPETITGTYVPPLIQAYETGLPQTFELDTIGVTGESVTKLMNYVPIKDARGAVRQVIVATYDLTERKRFERTLVEADRHKTEFLALLSHELRNPLTPIRYSLFVLDRAEPLSEQARRAKEIIGRQVDHLARIVDDLLDVTRISRGKIKLQRSSLDLGALVRRTVEDYAALFATNKLELDIDTVPKPLIVTGDPERIAQILGNLLQNAAKFTPAGGRVAVTLKPDQARRSALLAVRDTGVGITAEALPRLFEPFEQAAETLDRSSGGLGLGLALVRSLVEMHGGTVQAVSEGPGAGAEFVVHLPLEMAGATTDKVRAQAPARGPSRRVLIIEDNLDAASGLADFLRIENHDVQLARDGREGVDKARRFRPEVVFCDIGLPGMDGYRVAKAFRSDARLRSAYLVALTGYALARDRAKARASGFDEHLAKPPGLDTLRAILAKCAPVPRLDARRRPEHLREHVKR